MGVADESSRLIDEGLRGGQALFCCATKGKPLFFCHITCLTFCDSCLNYTCPDVKIDKVAGTGNLTNGRERKTS